MKPCPLRGKISSSGQWLTILISFHELGQQKSHLLRKCFQVMISKSRPTYHYVRIFFFNPLEAGFAIMLLSRIPKVHSQCQTTIKFSVMWTTPWYCLPLLPLSYTVLNAVKEKLFWMGQIEKWVSFPELKSHGLYYANSLKENFLPWWLVVQVWISE